MILSPTIIISLLLSTIWLFVVWSPRFVSSSPGRYYSTGATAVVIDAAVTIIVISVVVVVVVVAVYQHMMFQCTAWRSAKHSLLFSFVVVLLLYRVSIIV